MVAGRSKGKRCRHPPPPLLTIHGIERASRRTLYSCRDLQPRRSRTVPRGLRYRSPFLRIGHHRCRARRGAMRATKALRQTQIAVSLGRPKSQPLSMIADFPSDPTIILRVGPKSVIRSNLMVGHATTILRRYTSGADPSEWSVTEAKGDRPICGAEARASD